MKKQQSPTQSKYRWVTLDLLDRPDVRVRVSLRHDANADKLRLSEEQRELLKDLRFALK